MATDSITIANQNEEWLQQKVTNDEFSSKNEAVNFFINQAREQDAYIEYVRMKLDKAEKSSFSTKTKDELLVEIKQKLNVPL